ncbi:valine dehydrogenase [Kitasatospora sp. NBC_01250]|uniref:Glu/Leu/Phe/Val dehydrogenase dimerization domain-containing protein n=1 Tax=unclassified Kitasatospora TaxID=2633591 RepID=UPI002E0E5C4A|nr:MULTISPECIES: Glu/Leu/Phe/Val dehydrogenase dimerization domain-containing protein [unclassified Kitasatospora]WSJ68542.1 valine dehydrogenase [Kitasatospora sp. NBC_01302]
MTDVRTETASHPAPGVLSRIFRTEQDGAPGDGHEQVVLCHDRTSGLKAIIAIHSTALGPALGGTRFHQYATEEEALEDALRLSRGMSYKNALAGLDLGGGKAVIIGDPRAKTEGGDKSEALLRAYGRFVQSLAGRYVTACDVGTYVQDMDVVARESDFVTGRSPEQGGAGDSSILTAFGVFQGMRASAQARWGQPTLRGKRVGVAGVGKVGHYLVGHLVADGATVVITDVSEAAVNRVRAAHPDVEVVADTRALLGAALDVYAPCALGGALDDETVAQLTAAGTSVVCGAANNQLAHPGVEKDLADRGILYAPDYLVNSGGVIQVADEYEATKAHQGYSFERAKTKATRIFDTTLEIFTLATSDGVPPAVAADRLAERRMREISALRSVLLPGARKG